MPKDVSSPTSALKRLLAAEGIMPKRRANGEWYLDRPRGSQLGPARAITVRVGPKPSGTPGRGAPKGYNVARAMGMPAADWNLVRRNTNLILERTSAIDVTQAYGLQADTAIEAVVEKMNKVHRELEVFTPLGSWAQKAIIMVQLRIKSCAHSKLENAGKPKEERKKALPPPLQEQPTAPKKIGRPRKSQQPAPEPIVPSLPPSDEDNFNDGEFFALPTSNDADATMASAMSNLSMMLRGQEDDEGDNDDGGQFDMSQVASNPTPLHGGSVGTSELTFDTTPARQSEVAPVCAPKATPIAIAAPKNSHAPIAARKTGPGPTPAPVTTPAPEANPTPALAPAPAAMTGVAPAVTPDLVSTPASSPALPASFSLVSSVEPERTATTTSNTSCNGITTGPFRLSSTMDKSVIIWRGYAILPAQMANFRALAERQALGTKPRIAAMYKDLIDALASNPTYDPASEPDCIPKPTVGRARTRALKNQTDVTTPAPVPAPVPVAVPAPISTLIASPTPLANDVAALEKTKRKIKPKVKPIPVPDINPETSHGEGGTPAEDVGTNAEVDTAAPAKPRRGRTKPAAMPKSTSAVRRSARKK